MWKVKSEATILNSVRRLLYEVATDHARSNNPAGLMSYSSVDLFVDANSR